MNNLVKKFSVICVLLGLTAVANADSKTVPATNCTTESDEVDYSHSNYGGMSVSKKTNTLVQCPVMRDRTGNSPIPVLEVRLVRQGNLEAPGTERASCTARSMDLWGRIISTQVRSSPIAMASPRLGLIRQPSKRVVLRFTNIPTRAKGTVDVSCNLQGVRYELISLFWKE